MPIWSEQLAQYGALGLTALFFAWWALRKDRECIKLRDQLIKKAETWSKKNRELVGEVKELVIALEERYGGDDE